MKLGSIDLGRQTNVASRYLEAIDPFALDFYSANMGSTFSAANTVRYDNTVLYQFPSFSGFQFAGGYSFNFDTTRIEGVGFHIRENNRASTASLRYVDARADLGRAVLQAQPAAAHASHLRCRL